MTVAGMVGLALSVVAAVAPAQTPPAPPKAPPTDLTAQAAALAKARLTQLGAGYAARIDPARHIVYVSAVDEANLRRVIGLLSAHHAYQQKALFRLPLRWNTTVILPTLRDYRRLAPRAKAAGYYHFPSRTLYSVSFSDVLVHEFIHALHHNDMVAAKQVHPIWLAEGLATLYQGGRFQGRTLAIRPSPNLAKLHRALRQGKDETGRRVPEVRDLLDMDQKRFLDQAEICYGLARLVMLYLHEKGLLAKFYQTYKAGYAAERTGRAALEKVTGETMAEFQRTWREWVLTRKPPWRPGYKIRAHLGVRMQATPEGVQVTGLVRGSVAAKLRRLHVGDVIVAIAGQPTTTPQELSAAVQSCKPGHVVDVEVIRDGKPAVIKHLLGMMRPTRR